MHLADTEEAEGKGFAVVAEKRPWVKGFAVAAETSSSSFLS